MGDGEKAEVCVKCNQPISTHIPYKYEGQTFHSRCLVCNHCGRNLVGKPFTHSSAHVFCGEHCQNTFEAMPTTDLNSSQEGLISATVGQIDESLIEALENYDKSKHTLVKLSEQGSPMWNPDNDRITDYPVSISPDSLISRSPVHGSHSSSLSVSESSLNSDGSMSYDAQKKAGKKILKKPHGPRRHSTNRVRWKLPSGENDSDTTSLESFDSSAMSSTSAYQKALQNTHELRQNWRDFEESPALGSTGLTPARQADSKNGKSLMASPIRGSYSQHISLSPKRVVHATSSATDVRAMSSSIHRSTSPNSMQSPVIFGKTSSPQHHQYPSRIHHSTPLRRYQSDLSPTPGVYLPQIQTMHSRPQHPDTPGNFVNVPVLKIDDRSMHELDVSTPGAKQRAQIFKFPQPGRIQSSHRQNLHTQSSPRRTKPSEPPLCNGFHHPTAQGVPQTLEDDDADDYDHLQPKEENEELTVNDNQDRLRSDPYGDEDIDEALMMIGSEDGYDSEVSSLASPSHEQAPPLPPKGEQILPSQSPDLVQMVPKGPPGSMSNSNVTLMRNDEERVPPIPPKKQRNLHDQHLRHLRGKYKPLPPLPEVSPSQSPTMPSKPPPDRKGSQSPEVEDILPPPPQFSGILPRHDRSRPQDNRSPPPPPEEQLASSSDTTLIAGEQGDTRSSLSDLKTYPARSIGEKPDIQEQRVHPMHIARSSGEVHFSSHSYQGHRPGKGFRALESSNKTTQVHRSEQGSIQLGPELKMIRIPSSESDSSVDDNAAKLTHTVIQSSRQVKRVSPEPTLSGDGRAHQQAPGVQKLQLTDISRASATTPQHKMSMERKYSESNVSYQPQVVQSPTSRQRRSSEQIMEKTAGPSQLRRTASHQQSTMFSYAKVSDTFSPEDQQVLQMFYSGNKPPMMKPVFHDTERSIQKMLAELESEGSSDEKNDNRQPCGPCVSCKKMIINPRTLANHDGYNYHVKCFRCNICGCSLYGKKVFKVREKLLCRDDYPRFGTAIINGGPQPHPPAFRRRDQQVNSYSSPIQEHRLHSVSVHGGQVTSV